MSPPTYELYYWPHIQGRGEFVRLLFEEAGVPYVDVVRLPESQGGGVGAIMRFLRGDEHGALPLAPPFVRLGDVVLSQTPNILSFLAPRFGLVPADEAQRAEVNQIQLTLADLVSEVHDTHHPIGVGLYYDDQRNEAIRRARDFVAHRMPKFLSWLEHVLVRNQARGSAWLVGDELTYVDLSAFQLLEGLAYAFPRACARQALNVSGLTDLRARVAQRPRIAAYLASPRRIPFNQQGIFRHYPELDDDEDG